VYTVQTVHPSDTPNRLLAFDRSTGERDWIHEDIQNEGLHLGAGVVLASTDRAVRVVDPATGGGCRTIHVQGFVDRLLEDRELPVRPAVAGDQLFVCSAAPRATPNEPGHYWLTRVDLPSGTVRWTSDRFTVAEDFPEAVVADRERVYLPVGRRIQAFDHGGEPLWNEPVAPPNPNREGWPYVWKLAHAGSHLVVELATYEAPNEYVAVDAATGEVRWQRHDLWRQPVVAGDTVYARRDVEVEADRWATVLHALDVASGETMSTHQFEGRLRYQPRIVDGRLFAIVDELIDSGASMRLIAME
jgi:outer membrane protein assembly factor BamB